ncbi:hypothetical protein HRbin40_01948 [bacterium HR40]|nr:hypothetical protein HRbin40_01948 [bacterium HR40]
MRWLLSLILLLASLPPPRSLQAQPIIADLSDHLIAITTAFTGTDVLLFGAMERPGGDIVVMVSGPGEEVRVRRRSRVLLFWLNTDELVFRDVPGFYAVAASRPLAEIASEEVLARHHLGASRLPLEPVNPAGYEALEIGRFRRALVRNKVREGLWVEKPGTVTVLADRLFRTRLSFPANVPPGSYFVQTLYFRDGRLEHAQSNVLVISKVGLEADLYDLSKRRPGLYGVGAILLAVGAGWIANVVFARR